MACNDKTLETTLSKEISVFSDFIDSVLRLIKHASVIIEEKNENTMISSLDNLKDCGEYNEYIKDESLTLFTYTFYFDNETAKKQFTIEQKKKVLLYYGHTDIL